MQLTINVPESQDSLRLPGGMLDWTEDDFFEFCQANRDLRIERTAKGEIVVMSPAGDYSSYRCVEILSQLRNWAGRDKTGIVFDSSGGFRLPNGGVRAADASWVLRSRLQALSHHDKERFAPLCPDFVVEVASPSDRYSDLREKMEEYRQAGVRLGWLILPAQVTVEVYTAAGMTVLDQPEALSGEPALPGFRLNLAEIWNPPF